MGSLFINYITLYGQQWQCTSRPRATTGTERTCSRTSVKNDTGSSGPSPRSSRSRTPRGRTLRARISNSSKLMVTPPWASPTPRPWRPCKNVRGLHATDMGYSYADTSYQEQKIQNGINIVQIFMPPHLQFLILAALYERWALPLSIFMTVPIAALGAFSACTGSAITELYAQIGLVMLIGLAAKTLSDRNRGH
ncbi:MAG: efflux RND transporter permease subunit [Akkermansia muciniphila]